MPMVKRPFGEGCLRAPEGIETNSVSYCGNHDHDLLGVLTMVHVAVSWSWEGYLSGHENHGREVNELVNPFPLRHAPR